MRREHQPNFSRLAALFIAAFILGFLQNSSLIAVSGIKPNLILIALVAFSFFITSPLLYIFLFFLTQIILRFEAGSEFMVIPMGIIALIAFIFHDKLPARPFLNNLILIALGTPLFYAIFDFSYLYIEPLSVLGEMAYNIILGAVLFFILSYGRKASYTS